MRAISTAVRATLTAGAILTTSSAFAAEPSVNASASPLPTITSVHFSGHGGSYTATILGRNFGAAPVAVPCTGCTLPEFYFSSFGWRGAANILKWTNTHITIAGLPGAAGKPAIIGVMNDSLKQIASWAGNFPGKTAGTPTITHLAFSGSGANLQMVITGKGFGAAPAGVPGQTRLAQFIFFDWNVGDPMYGNDLPWAAGAPPDTVALNYSSWTDTKIVVNGFSSAYGQTPFGWTANPRDPVAIGVTSTTTGLATARAARLP